MAGTRSTRRRCGPRLAALALLALPALAACRGTSPAPDGRTGASPFHSPQGIAATSRYVLVVNSGFHFEGGRPAYARGSVSVLERGTRRLLGEIPSSAENPQRIATHGERAYLVCSGGISIDAAGLATPSSDGALDVLDLSQGVPAAPAASLRLPRSGADPRIGAYGGLALSPDGKRAFLGSGTRGDVFVVDLEALRLLRGPEQPLELFPTAPGANGLTVPVPAGARLAVLDFNSDALCLSSKLDDGLADRRCGGVGAQPELLEGPLDAADDGSGRLLVLMSLANALYRVDLSQDPFTVERSFAATGLSANRVVVHGGSAYVVNSLSNNLQRVALASGKSDLPFAVLPVRSNPYDLVITEEAEGALAWVTLQGSDQVAVISLASGGVIALLPDGAAGDGGARDGSRDGGAREASPADQQRCPDGGAPVVGVGEVVRFSPGEGGGSGQDRLPEVIQGPPAGPMGGALDVLSLGVGGELVVGFGDYDLVDGPGPDFIVYENPFLTGPYQPYAEPAVVGVSASSSDAASFVDFPCDLSKTKGDPQQQSWPYPGCAGVHPVLAGKGSCVAPSDAAAAGGDAFDLATLGLARGRYLRLKDAGLSTMGTTTRGFDLDAVVLIHYTKR